VLGLQGPEVVWLEDGSVRRGLARPHEGLWLRWEADWKLITAFSDGHERYELSVAVLLMLRTAENNKLRVSTVGLLMETWKHAVSCANSG
jgi:hypothetical protein